MTTTKSGGYLSSTLSKVIADGYLTGGEIKDAAKPQIENENFDRRHAHAGIVSLAASSCQFTITLGEAKFLDGKNVVVGQVNQGMDVLKEIAKVPTDLNQRPRIPITITACGNELVDFPVEEQSSRV
jgi:cyclophilin family peptidyl-prolyl cis-trans isomerase